MSVKKPFTVEPPKKRRESHQPHPLVWWTAAVVLAVLCALTALWRNADEEPKVALTRVPEYLGETLSHPDAAASGSTLPGSAPEGQLIPVSR